MSFRQSGLLLVVAVLLGVFIYLYEMADESAGPDGAAAETLAFPGIEAEAISAIELDTSDGVRARAERRDGHWMLVEPLSFRGDNVTIEAIASALAQLEVAGRVGQGPALEAFGLAEAGTELAFEVEGGRRAIRIGTTTPVGSNTYVQLGEGGDVVFVQTWRTNALRKSLKELRNRRILDFDHASLGSVSVRWPEGRVELERRGDEWWIREPLDAPADQRSVQNLLSDLAFLQAEGFIDERPEDDDLGLTAPRFQVVLGGETVEGGSFKLGFAIGADRGGALVARGSDGHLYELAPGRLDDFPRDLFAYRFKELARFEVADARRFELIYRVVREQAETGVVTVTGSLVEDAWTTEPESMDPGRASAMVAELARLDADGLVAEALGDDELASLGLAPARLTIRVFGEDDEPLADLALGILQEGRGILARRADSPVIYRLDEVVADIVPQSPLSIREDFAPEPDSALEEIGAGELAPTIDLDDTPGI